ncbi:hypothetical protein ACJMK2_012666 [Sinanodonta woodiana]|uniref:Uncharacterized protein n=1 Tax=Sinanodonta woodiana TaxID=1069815 RepID=A0ABD3V8X6_SINWO
MGNKEPSRNLGLLFSLPPPKTNKSSRSHPDFLSFDQIKNSLSFTHVDWSYFYSAQKSLSIKEKFEYLYSIIDRKFEKPLIRIQASFHLGYYVCRYEELDRVECFSVIRKHMSLRHARNYRLLYRELGCYRTLAHCTVPTRHIIMRVKHVRDLIQAQNQEEIDFLTFPRNRDPYQFLKAYEEWFSLKESAVYQLGLPDNHCEFSVIKQNTESIFMDISKEDIWMIEDFLNNSAEEDRYLLMYNKGGSGNCIVLHRNKSGKFSLMDDRLLCLKNMEPEDKVHLLVIK